MFEIVNGPAGTSCVPTRTLLARISVVLGSPASPDTASSGVETKFGCSAKLELYWTPPNRIGRPHHPGAEIESPMIVVVICRTSSQRQLASSTTKSLAPSPCGLTSALSTPTPAGPKSEVVNAADTGSTSWLPPTRLANTP
jgi:hypothetical protein